MALQAGDELSRTYDADAPGGKEAEVGGVSCDKGIDLGGDRDLAKGKVARVRAVSERSNADDDR